MREVSRFDALPAPLERSWRLGVGWPGGRGGSRRLLPARGRSVSSLDPPTQLAYESMHPSIHGVGRSSTLSHPPPLSQPSNQIIEDKLLRSVVSSWFDHSSRHLVSWVVVLGGELLRSRTLLMAWRGYVSRKRWVAEVVAGGVAARNSGVVEDAWLTWWVASFRMR